MALSFHTASPKKLLDNFDAKIKQTEQAGKITTWEKSQDGKYYTHKADDWAKKAWFKPDVATGELRFNIIKPQDSKISIPVYGYYHGHLIETFLNHFDKEFSIAQATALPTSGDNCG